MQHIKQIGVALYFYPFSVFYEMSRGYHFKMYMQLVQKILHLGSKVTFQKRFLYLILSLCKFVPLFL